ncbi:MetQ/NlpA family ABC transporter substrate-binding protein [Hathewaya histolytica]|uniref:NLPA lipoprotein n=1 Tax=Hathewaya histolytica TaxID=1498 RepID=A0A4V6Z161_HATHI|nr:MetQ/NlpA family ABC transporter substrate-binding protein [Hathewaya histolytica]VTQ85427.1 NLPA lipoprotein [Hathewaya histolytica]
MFKKFICTILLATLCVSASACGSKTSSSDAKNEDAKQKKVIKLATISAQKSRLEWAKEILAEKGINAEIVVFDGNSMPATALKDGDVDGVLVNHKKWMETFNKENKSSLVMMKPYYYYSPIRMYSKKHTTIEAIPKNAKISVSNDPSNLDIALKMLQDVGLIKLGKKTGEFYTPVDIVENSKNIKLIMAETINVARSLDDADAVISFTFYVKKAGGIDVKKFLYENPTDKDQLPVGLIVQEKDKEAEWAKYLAEHFVSEKYLKKAKDVYGDSYVCYE